MRACFLKSNVAALGYGYAIVQSQPVAETEKLPPDGKPLAEQQGEVFAAPGDERGLDPYHT
jgi:hypothetical protein